MWNVEAAQKRQTQHHADTVAIKLAKCQIETRKLKKALRGLLNYTGGWDETDPKHPIYKARKALGE